MSMLEDKHTHVLKLAMDSVNLGLCDLHDYFACPLLIAQITSILTFMEESCLLLIALLIA